MTKEQEEAINVLYHLAHINTYLDLYSEKDIKLDTKTIKEWKKATTLVLDLIQQQQEENKQKDKMTDEMIEEYEFFHRANIINFCEDKLRKNTCIQDCKLCIKQYFKKKASE